MSFLKELKSIKVRINYLLLAIIGIYLYLGYGVEIIIALASIFFHEIGHVILSIRLGVDMDEVELFPFGGIAKSEGLFWFSMSEEVLVAAIGPTVNFILALFFYGISKMGLDNQIINLIIKSNIIIGGFNFLPIFPLDGGKILRAALSYRMGFKLATKRLTILTYVITICFIVFGIIQLIIYQTGLYFVLLSIFVSLAARKENKMAAFLFIHEIMCKRGELIKNKVMGTHLLVGISTVTLKEMTAYFLPKRYHIIIVIDGTGKSLGTINESELLDAILEFGIDVTLEKLLFKKEK